ncbi:MAG: hypothetical protein RML94_10710 [Bacteroidia bacterium]|nr:hypothetical protein [Bacteroidia bacterium]
MRRACVSTVRSTAKHRSVSVARSTPTLPTQAQAKCGQGHAQKNYNHQFLNNVRPKINILMRFYTLHKTCST